MAEPGMALIATYVGCPQGAAHDAMLMPNTNTTCFAVLFLDNFYLSAITAMTRSMSSSVARTSASRHS